MPMKNRNYKQERKTMLARGERDDHAERLRLRRKAVKAGIVKAHDGKDLAHKTAMSKGGDSSLGNIEVQSKGKNRSFSRNPDGSMKSEESKRERKK